MLSIKSVFNDIILHINILLSNVVQMYATDGFECFYHPISFVGITIAAKINKIDGVKAANQNDVVKEGWFQNVDGDRETNLQEWLLKGISKINDAKKINIAEIPIILTGKYSVDLFANILHKHDHEIVTNRSSDIWLGFYNTLLPDELHLFQVVDLNER